jgi:hypothetical protein
MQENKHPIDSMLEEIMEGFAVEPSANSWNAVSAGLDKYQAVAIKRKLFIRWSMVVVLSAIVAFFVILKSCDSNGEYINYSLTDRSNINHSNYQIYQVAQSTFEASSEGEIIYSRSISQSYTDNVKSEKTVDKPLGIQSTIQSPKAKSDDNTTPVSELVINQSNENKILLRNDEIMTSKDSQVLLLDEVVQSEVETAADVEPIYTSTDNWQKKPESMDSSSPSVVQVNTPPPGPQIATGLQLEIGAGPSIIFNNSPSRVDYDQPLVEFNQNMLMPSPEVFVHLKYSLGNLYIKSGFQFSEFGQKSNFERTIEMHDTSGGYASWLLDRYWSYDTIGFFDDPYTPGLVYPILQPTYHIDTLGSQWNSRDQVYFEKSNISATNRYRYVEIPLIVGFQYSIKRITLHSGIGLSVGRMVNTTGRYVVNGVLENTSLNLNPYNNFHYNYMMQLGAVYALDNNWNMLLQTSYKTNLNSIYRSEFGRNTRYHSIGIQLGVSYNIK